ncbi:MAG TPA: FCD domain-containing protein [Acidimicrobiales bacterium]|nr:FCD domain-containing protein [Acidimicrobiales bacterium]
MAVARDDAEVTTKLASKIARELEEEIRSLQWPVGEVLGSEAELIERFHVSRAAIREAIRIVEHDGAATMRRGPGGGLVVTAPDPTAVATAASMWFASRGISASEVLHARDPLVLTAVRGAAESSDEDGVQELDAFVSELQETGRLGPRDFIEIDVLIARISGSPVLYLFISALSDVLTSRLLGTRTRLVPPVDRESAELHLTGYRRVADAIIRGDGGEAQARMAAMLRAAAARMQDRPLRPRRNGPVIPEGPGKLGERVAMTIADDIERSGWQEGSVFGSSADLMERYGVSLAVLREAVRILEHYGAVTTKRGPGGGLVIIRPDWQSIVRAAELELDHEGVTLPQLLDARAALEMESVRLAAARIDDEVAEDLRAALAADPIGSANPADFHEVHRHLATASGSRPLALFVDVLTELTMAHVPRRRRSQSERDAIWAEVSKAHTAIVDAVIAGEVPLAQRRMLRHLEATIATLD